MTHDPRKAFTPQDWYWHWTGGRHRPDVPGEPVFDLVYSSAKGASVPVTDPDYVVWVAAAPMDRTTRIDTEDDMKAVLEARGQTFGVPAS